MAIAFSEAQNNGVAAVSATSIVATISSTGASSFISGIVTWGTDVTSDLSSITDNGGGGGTWVIKRRLADVGNSQSAAFFYGYNLPSGITQVIANFGTSVPYRGISVQVFTGVKTAGDPLDSTNEQGQLQSSPGTGTDAVQSGSGTQTPTQDNCVVVGHSVNTGQINLSGSSEFTAGTHFTEPANAEHQTFLDISLSSEYEIQTTAAARNASFTVSAGDNHITFQGIFQDPGGGGGGGGGGAHSPIQRILASIGNL